MFNFGDSKYPQNIPFEFAALYSADCDFPCPADIAGHWDRGHKRWITFKGDPAASILDFEPGTRSYQDPELIRVWLEGRARNKSTRLPWVYSDLSNAQKAAQWANGYHFMWWIPTLDGIQRSRQELAALLSDYGVPANYAQPALIAAQQIKTVYGTSDAEFDMDICFGGW